MGGMGDMGIMGSMGTMGTMVLQDVIRWLGGNSLQAGVLVVIILAVQGMMRERIPARWRHAMWLLLVARLIMPWTPPSRWSVYNLFEPLKRYEKMSLNANSLPSGERATLREAFDGSDVPPSNGLESSGVLSSVGMQEFGSSAFRRNLPSTDLEHGRLRTRSAPEHQAAPVRESQSPLQPVSPPIPDPSPSLSEGVPATFAFPASFWLAGAWLAGVVAVLGMMLAQSLRLGAIVRRQRPVTDQGTLELLEECKERMGLRAWLVVVESPEMRSPALLGFIRPRLLLPAGAVRTLGPERLRHVFLHELAHLKRRDILLNWLIALLQALHWFNPLVWMGFHRMRGDREMACDALALACLKPEETRDYGRTIIDLLDRFARPQALPGLAGILEDKAQIKRRITMIAQFRKISFFGSALAAVLMLLVGGVTLTGAAPRAGTGYVKAAFDRPFVSDPEVVGVWQSVDFVRQIEDFKPGAQAWRGGLYLKGLAFIDGGTTSGPWQWTKGYLWHPGDKAEGKYEIRTMNGEQYLFMEWISGDVTIRGMTPWYYVMKKTGAGEALTPGQRAMIEKAAQENVFPPAEQAAKIVVGQSTMQDAIAAFGEPLAYVWGNEKFPKDKLPGIYCMQYPHQFLVVVERGVVSELRHHEPGFVFKGKLQVGSSEEEALKVLGEPGKVVSNQTGWDDGVLYKNTMGHKGNDYYARPDQGVRIFFMNGKICGLYQTPVRAMKKAESSTGASGQSNARSKYVKERFDHPFVNDPDVIGSWESVDFVRRIEDFTPGQKSWQGDLYLKGVSFLENGKTDGPWAWTQGYLWHPGDRAEGPYVIKELNGEKYLFMAWISGDVTIRGMEPCYYVMKKKAGAGELSARKSARTDAAAKHDVAGGTEPADWPARFEAVKKELGQTKTRYEVGMTTLDELQAAAAKLSAIPPEAGRIAQAAAHMRLEVARDAVSCTRKRVDAGIAPPLDLKKAEAEVKIAQALCDGDRKAAARAELEKAQATLEYAQIRFAVGAEPKDKLIRAEAGVKIAQAHIDGDALAEARARLEQAERLLELVKVRRSVMPAEQSGVDQAEAEVKACQEALEKLKKAGKAGVLPGSKP